MRLHVAPCQQGCAQCPGCHHLQQLTRSGCLPGAKLEEVLKPLGLTEQRAALQYELSYGQLASEGTQGWHIMHSTLPGRAGQALLGPQVSGQSLQGQAAAGQRLAAGAFCPPAGWLLSDWSGGIPTYQPTQ